MRDEYNINRYDGVRKKFNYTASADKLRCLFYRHNLEFKRFNRWDKK